MKPSQVHPSIPSKSKSQFLRRFRGTHLWIIFWWDLVVSGFWFLVVSGGFWWFMVVYDGWWLFRMVYIPVALLVGLSCHFQSQPSQHQMLSKKPLHLIVTSECGRMGGGCQCWHVCMYINHVKPMHILNWLITNTIVGEYIFRDDGLD